MNRKEWLEVGKQSLYFFLGLAAMALLLEGTDLLMGVMGFAQSKPLEGEKLIIILGAWWLMFSMFLGLTPFAMDSKQKGLEYLLTLPYSRRRLLFIKFLPRLVAAILFYLAFAILYGLIGSDAFGGGFAVFSLSYFALFLISFSLSVVHENFIVQSIWAAIALCGYLALCLYIYALGFSWKFGMPSSWVGNRIWLDLNYDAASLFTAIAVFFLMATPFVLSFFMAFRKFDLKPIRAFNRRHLLIFVPLLLLALVASLGVTYLAQKNSVNEHADFYLLRNQHLLKVSFPGKLDLFSEAGRRRIDTQGAFFWDRLLLQESGRLFLSGYDSEDRSRFIASLNLADLSWKVLHRCPNRYFVAPGFRGFQYDGEGFVYLRRSRDEAERPGMDSNQVIRSDVLELVSLDLTGRKNRTIVYKTPLFRKYYEPQFLGNGRMNGLRFWLIAHRWQKVFRLWEDGRVEDLGLSKGLPAYYGNLLFTIADNSLQMRKLLAEGSEVIKEFAGEFKLVLNLYSPQFGNPVEEVFAERNKRIVRIDLARPDGMAVDDIGPMRGNILMVPPGHFYYIEFQNWPGLPTDQWKKLYRLQGNKMVFLRQFDFNDSGYGHIRVGEFGFTTYQSKNDKIMSRFFAFPDLRELKFKKLN